ncbi:MAG TPA: hypothetical protein OIM50_05615 [Clostridiaceae bacterium]|nr:hypothetical protein [Clostridiaceae bacterium]
MKNINNDRKENSMNKTNKILICALIALISGVIGFIIGINVNVNLQNDKGLVGTYKTNTWNGKEAIIALQKDKTMICPNGSGTWALEDGKLYIEYDYEILKFSETGEQEYEKIHSKQEVMIVENGLMLSGHFFEKINK